MSSPLLAPVRLLLVCPHPDDETLGAGLLLQEVVSRGGQVRVLYLTDGDNNPIPQFLSEGRWPFGAAARGRWGARRRVEAQQALRILGLDDAAAEHWSLPDQGLSRLVDRGGEGVVTSLAATIASFGPTLLVTPSSYDLHDDHVAAATLVRRALASVPPAPDMVHLVYRIHGARPSLEGAHVPPASLSALDRKTDAMSAHATQLVASRRRMLQLAGRQEALWTWEADVRNGAQSWRTVRRLLHLLPVWTTTEADCEEGTATHVPVEES
jgi:LmbE family N-acetylglucosaminyl deacetylase